MCQTRQKAAAEGQTKKAAEADSRERFGRLLKEMALNEVRKDGVPLRASDPHGDFSEEFIPTCWRRRERLSGAMESVLTRSTT